MEPSDIVERLRGAAQSWRQEDAMEGRIGEEEARFHDEAAAMIEQQDAEIERLRAALADITYENKGKVVVAYMDGVDLAGKWPFLRDLHGRKP